MKTTEDVRTLRTPTWPWPDEAMRTALERVLESRHWWQSGEGEAERLEEWLATEHSVLGAVAVTNGTHALELSLRALGIGPGDDVLVPAVSFISTATSVSFVGARPIAVDIEHETLCLSPDDLDGKVSPSTRALIVVHLGGVPAEMNRIVPWAAERGLFLIEDAAQGIGARSGGRPVGAIGDVGTFSFQASKLLAAGEGGAVLVRSDPAVLERATLLANCGRPRGSKTYDHTVIGSNFRISEFHAALLMTQVESLHARWAERQAAAEWLADEVVHRGLGQPIGASSSGDRVAWYTFGLRLPDGAPPSRDVARELQSNGLPANSLYTPFYQTAAYRALDFAHAQCPTAERAAQEVILLHHSQLLGGEPALRRFCDVLEMALAPTRSWKQEALQRAINDSRRRGEPAS